ncbi:IgGFc-binding protein-like [Acipenser ruthenus]|uniref:IgGFc-binding protein-like n=1 Tax=Acipenser ruthenus TaxID=7906 RepID=UPI002741880A|nr:IgGFc-binding protein-like [Acipenser ruthenus]
MWRKLLLICVFYVLSGGICSASPAGREFVNVFLQHNGPSLDSRLEVMITAYSASTLVKVQVYQSSFRKEFTLFAGQRMSVELPRKVQMRGNTYSSNACIVQADQEVSVLAVSCKSRACVTSLLYPVGYWGNHYYAITPQVPQQETYGQIVITNHEYKNAIEVSITSQVTFQGTKYSKGDVVKITLSEFQSVQLQGANSLSGTEIRTRKSVGVMCGFTCSPKNKVAKCHYGFQQLIPAPSWGLSYVVPPLPSPSGSDLVYIVAFQTTRIHIQYNTAQQLKDVLGGTVAQFQVDPSSPMYITASKGVQVIYFCTGSVPGALPAVAPFMMGIADTGTYCFNYAFTAMPSFQNSAVMVANGANGILIALDQKPLPPDVHWSPVKESDYSWAVMAIAIGDHSVRQQDGIFGLYIVGTASESSYGYPAVCTEEIADPCQVVRCGYNSRCQVRNNSAVCVSDSRTCWAWGDPHYHTFDRTDFDFQGNCTYTLVQTPCGGSDATPSFTIQAANENRGSAPVSFVRTVYITLMGVNITIVKEEQAFVRVNGVKHYLPLTLQDGKIKIYYSGSFAVVEADFGLAVKYNWNHHLVINLASKFSGQVCGLCGNYNDNPADDFVTPDGTAVSSGTEMGRSWKAKRDDGPFCVDDCNDQCPQCSEDLSRAYGTVSYCGLLVKQDGPFRDCHSWVDPEAYVLNCAFDLCVYQGDQTLFCRALKTYADTCQGAGIKVYDWRGITQCPMNCLENSHYESCGSACPATCSDPEASARCQLPCVETCQCNVGYLRSGNLCVPAQRCGCTYQGYYYPPSEKFWADESCTQQCTCDLYTSRVTCIQASCKPSEECRLVDGVWGCYPSLKSSFKTCSAEGDPHYTTFDGRWYDFQGTCIYQLVALCSYNPSLTPFEVHVQNDNRGSTVVSYSKMVRVKVYDMTIEITKGYSGKVQVDGILTNLPYSLSNGNVKIYKIGMTAVVRTDFGLSLTFDWNSRVTVTVPDAYSGSLCGLCGNYNGDPADDLIGKNGQTVLSPDAFGGSWKTGDVPGCVDGCQGSCSECSDKEKLAYAGSGFCGRITDPRGPFRDCLGVVDPKRFFENCVYDVCIYKGLQSILCQSIASYVARCQEVKANIYSWRSKGFCDMPCPANTTYELCTAAFPLTCVESPVPLGAPCMEDCRCVSGFVLSGARCVLSSECGCRYNNMYYQAWEIFFPDKLCQQQCTCRSDGQVECRPYSCAKGKECRVENGVRKCIPVTVSGTCSASGDSHYRSFDGRAFDFQGTCTYTLAVSCPKWGAMGSVEPFSVHVQNEKWDRGTVSVTKLVEMGIYGSNFTLTQGLSGKVKVNGVLENLPFVLGDIRVYRKGVNVVIKSSTGIKVTYDLHYQMSVTVPQTYMGQMCGLCGNYNGNPRDDFQLADGSQTTDIRALGSSWKVFVPGADCEDGCGNDCPRCDTTWMAVFKSKVYCGMITAPSGPFGSCISKVKPHSYFNDCVYDLCLSSGDVKQLCHSLQAYTAACQEAGVQIQPWRNESFCPLQCPPFSHYALCADSCLSTCYEVSDVLDCSGKCSEGCECDVGYIFDGHICVAAEECSCFENGRRYRRGEVMLMDYCTKSCTCAPPGPNCRDFRCSPDQTCGVQNGVLTCLDPDLCKITCGPMETCRLQNGVGVCVPLSTVNCWAWGDTHYRTFDGYNYDFQGTCTYVLAMSNGSSYGLVPFSIEEKNENRGNAEVSLKRVVHISVHGFKVCIHKQEHSTVRVNNQIANLPVTLANGQLRVYQRGVEAILETDFGLRVSYDWNSNLIINLPGSYQNKTDGLCGNFNGVPDDDRTLQNGTQAATVQEWATRWKVNDGDEGCCSSCQEQYKPCTPEETSLYKSQVYCGILNQQDGGPFGQCHRLVDPDPFFTGCVNDVCQHGGTRQVLCQALEAYAVLCGRAGATVMEWRDMCGCPLSCPDNSHYEYCGSACPLSCGMPQGIMTCISVCVQGCFCDPGYMLSVEGCVKPEDCGCVSDGRYYKPGESFWTSSRCRQHCICDSGTKTIQCKNEECASDQRCMLLEGVLDCHPFSSFKCTALGRSHYSTFDGFLYDFQGSCSYQLVGVCSEGQALDPFEIQVFDGNCGNRLFYSKDINIKVYGTVLIIKKAFPCRVQVNGLHAALPYYFNTDQIIIYQSGWSVVVETDFGLKVVFDWNSAITVSLPSTYNGAVCGLCGNANDDTSDDLLTRNGELALNPQEFGTSWQNETTSVCESVCSPGPKNCTTEQEQRFEMDQYCGILLNAVGPFAHCHAAVDPEPYLRNCVSDSCAYGGHFSAICNSLAAYTAACQASGATVYQWRSDTFCDAVCPLNSHYNLCGTSCPATCSGLSTPVGCNEGCKEGCQCDSGFVLSGDKCVPPSDCGCVYKDQYYSKGIFYPDEQCRLQCFCEDASVQCNQFSCGPQELCGVKSGVRKCLPIDQGKCLAVGGTGFVTFDGHQFTHHGACTYILAKSQGQGLVNFTVLLQTKTDGGKVALTRMAVLLVHGFNITVEQAVQWQVKVNGEDFNLPLKLNRSLIWAYQEGGSIVLQTDFGLKLFSSSSHYLQLSVPGSYRGRVSGLCGNFNGRVVDDLLLPSGALASNLPGFAAGWTVARDGELCEDGCGLKCPFCDPARKTLYSSSCGLITSASGPFSTCQSLVDPRPYFQLCVKAQCDTAGSQEALCRSVEAYATACQVEGGSIKPWRRADFCTLPCKQNSHFDVCADSCGNTCAGITSPFPCEGKCLEGCRCDDGYVFDGDRCVPMSSCGCVYDGRYIKFTEKLYSRDCSESCWCHPAGGLVCESVACGAEESCLVRSGVRGCFGKESVCQLIQGSRLLSFDGMSGVLGTGASYELVSLCEQVSEKWIRIVVYSGLCNGTLTPRATALHIFLGQTLITVQTENVWVNGRSVTLPVDVAVGISAGLDASNGVVVRQGSEVEIGFSSTGDVTVKIASSWYSGKLCGACGNLNGDPSDEGMNSNGPVDSSWIARDFSLCSP